MGCASSNHAYDAQSSNRSHPPPPIAHSNQTYITPNHVAAKTRITAVVVGLQNRSDLNGKVVHVLEFIRLKKRYSVKVLGRSDPSDQEALAIKPTNLIFSNGTKVAVDGLVSMSQFNGKEGVVTSWTKETGRYCVELKMKDEQSGMPVMLSIKPLNALAMVVGASFANDFNTIHKHSASNGNHKNDSYQHKSNATGRGTMEDYEHASSLAPPVRNSNDAKYVSAAITSGNSDTTTVLSSGSCRSRVNSFLAEIGSSVGVPSLNLNEKGISAFTYEIFTIVIEVAAESKDNYFIYTKLYNNLETTPITAKRMIHCALLLNYLQKCTKGGCLGVDPIDNEVLYSYTGRILQSTKTSDFRAILENFISAALEMHKILSNNDINAIEIISRHSDISHINPTMWMGRNGNHRISVNRWLAQIGESVGKNIKLNNDGVSAFTYEDLTIVIEQPQSISALFVYTMLQNLSTAQNAESIKKAAIKMNYLQQKTRGGCLSIDSEQNRIMYSFADDVNELSAGDFRNILENFIDTALTLANELKNSDNVKEELQVDEPRIPRKTPSLQPGGSTQKNGQDNRKIINNYLVEIGSTVGKDIKLNDQGISAFTYEQFNEFTIVIEVPETVGSLFIYTNMRNLKTASNTKEMEDRALRLNYLCKETHGGCLCVDPNDNELMYSFSCRIENLTSKSFRSVLENFIDTALTLYRKLIESDFVVTTSEGFGAKSDESDSLTHLDPNVWSKIEGTSHRVAVGGYLTEISASVGKNINLNEQGICAFTYENLTIVIECPANIASLFVYTSLHRLNNAINPQAVKNTAMRLNYLQQETRGGCVSIDPINNEIMYSYTDEIKEINSTDFRNILENFIDSALNLSKILEENDTGESETQVNAFDLLGVSVHWLQTGFMAEVEAAGFHRESKIYEIENLNGASGVIRKRGEHVPSPSDGKLGSAYVHALEGEDKVGTATFMLSYSWGYTVGDIIDTLADYCTNHDLDMKSTYIWICCLCVNQHRVVAQSELQKSGMMAPEAVDFFGIFRSRVTSIGKILAMMAPWYSPLYLKRVWCVFEVFMASQYGCEVAIVMPPAEKNKFSQAIVDTKEDDSDKKIKKGIDKLYETLASTRVEDANASVEEDKEKILGLLKNGVGFKKLNNRVNELLRQWVRRVIDQLLKERYNNIKDRSFDESYALFCRKVAEIFLRNGELDEAFQLHSQSVVLYESIFGTNHKETATAYVGLGDAKNAKGDYDGALAQFQNALIVREALLGRNHAETADCYIKIGGALENKGKYDAAMEEYQKALDIRLLVLGPDDPDTAGSFSSIGNANYYNGHYDLALIEYRKALPIQEAKLGKKHEETLTTYNNIGMCLYSKGEFDEALSELRKSLELKENAFGLYHPETALAYSNIGQVLQSKGDNDWAMLEYRKALAIQESVLGSDHPSTATTYHSIGSVLCNKGDLDASLSQLNKALSIRISVLGKDHPATTGTLEWITHIRGIKEKQSKESEEKT